jgi:hypothetical protein
MGSAQETEIYVRYGVTVGLEHNDPLGKSRASGGLVLCRRQLGMIREGP